MKREEVILKTDDARVRIIELEAGAIAPMHRHSEVTDNMFGLSGTIVIDLQAPDCRVTLGPGERCEVAVGRLHQVRNGSATEPARYLLVQGVGRYDFLEVND